MSGSVNSLHKGVQKVNVWFQKEDTAYKTINELCFSHHVDFNDGTML